jgi:hypothetical protein
MMIDQLPKMRTPTWLSKLSASSIENEPFPLSRILRDSLYYPSSWFDGDPVRHLAGNILSFIYVDYGHEQSEFDQALHDQGFRGYEVLAKRTVTRQELAPHGWRPTQPFYSDGAPQNLHDLKTPFCTWVVMQRQPGMPRDHGPARFSLLYLCADGAAAFDALYVTNGTAPKAIAIIQPGHAFGGNWTDFTDPGRILARFVLSNPAGQPEFLLYGGYGSRDFFRDPCWPGYQKQLCFLEKSGGGSIGVWSR